MRNPLRMERNKLVLDFNTPRRLRMRTVCIGGGKFFIRNFFEGGFPKLDSMGNEQEYLSACSARRGWDVFPPCLVFSMRVS